MTARVTRIVTILLVWLSGPVLAMDFYGRPLDFWGDTVISEELQEPEDKPADVSDEPSTDPYAEDLRYFSEDTPPELRDLYLDPSPENASRFVEATKRRIERARLISEMIKKVRSRYGITGIEETLPPSGQSSAAMEIVDLQRSVSVYLFLSSTCEACHDEVAEVNRLVARYPFMRLSAILIDAPTREDVQTYTNNHRVDFPVFPADPHLVRVFGVDTTPYLVFYLEDAKKGFFLRGRHTYAEIDERIREIYGFHGGGS